MPDADWRGLMDRRRVSALAEYCPLEKRSGRRAQAPSPSCRRAAAPPICGRRHLYQVRKAEHSAAPGFAAGVDVLSNTDILQPSATPRCPPHHHECSVPACCLQPSLSGLYKPQHSSFSVHPHHHYRTTILCSTSSSAASHIPSLPPTALSPPADPPPPVPHYFIRIAPPGSPLDSSGLRPLSFRPINYLSLQLRSIMVMVGYASLYSRLLLDSHVLSLQHFFSTVIAPKQMKVWIILGAVLGTLVLSGVAVLSLFCWKRSKRRVRGFSLRAVTPLDDAEFESWRRPSQYTQRPEKYGIRPTQPALLRDRVSPTSPTLFEKELSTYQFPPRTPSPTDLAPAMKSPSDSIRRPDKVRRKSSVASSIADRPPTPYSPTSPSSDFQRGSMSSRRSQPLIHHTPTMSEASAFKFDFEKEYGTQRNGNEHWYSNTHMVIDHRHCFAMITSTYSSRTYFYDSARHTLLGVILLGYF
ncbi:hypothetical protein T440DRAFT_485257 [Plenodomus tracheiphilus IPT5]|uniref:Uncharacterized protein n=1 Tax=Plenodomus tracheiphilus IPT5 TaxID=1408161 RepID=A0A6A7BNL7_9PLEO|nr:hypothetical protein T440DRAFT_485257 [Plenodomus tracheiphilus IPT5]